MATSGTVALNLTAREVVTFALRKIRVCSVAETPAAEDAEHARLELSLLLKTLALEAPHLWRQTFGTVTPLTFPSFLLSPRPITVVEARFRDIHGRDLPMVEMTRQEYVDLPQKTSTGTPTSYYVDQQRDATTLYIWPMMAAATTEAIHYTYQRIIEDVSDLNEDLDIPQEHLELVGYELADRLLDTYGKDMPRVTARAAYLRGLARDHDRETVVRIIPERRYG
jgi:hypothetical protein